MQEAAEEEVACMCVHYHDFGVCVPDWERPLGSWSSYEFN